MNGCIRFIKQMSQSQWILICILVLAAFIRLYQSTQYVPFSEEQVDDMLTIRSTWHNLSTGNIKGLSLKGQSGTYRMSYLGLGELTPVYHGVLYYYVLMPAAVISQFNPYGVVLFLITLGVIAIYLLYDVGNLLFHDERVGLLAAFFGANSFWMSAYSRWIWTPSMLPFFSLLSWASFLRVISGKRKWWYPLVVSLSLASQMHDSGYVLILFFSGALLLYKPRLPKESWKKVLLLIFAIGPIIPTLINEYAEKFRMTRSLSTVFYNALPTLTTVGESLLRFLRSAYGSTIMSQTYIESTFHFLGAHVWIFVGFCMALGVTLYVEQKQYQVYKSKIVRELDTHYSVVMLLASWWALCLLVSVFVEYLYADQVLNDYSRMNNLAFALPVFFICLSWIYTQVWKRYSRVVVWVGICIFISLNGVIIHDYLWSYTERDWAYKDLKTISWLIPHHAGDVPYDLVVYRYQEGSYESKNVYVMLYFIENYPARMPEKFNGAVTWGPTKERLEGKTVHQHMIVMDKRYVGVRELPTNAIQIDKTQGYYLYRVMD